MRMVLKDLSDWTKGDFVNKSKSLTEKIYNLLRENETNRIKGTSSIVRLNMESYEKINIISRNIFPDLGCTAYSNNQKKSSNNQSVETPS